MRHMTPRRPSRHGRTARLLSVLFVVAGLLLSGHRRSRPPTPGWGPGMPSPEPAEPTRSPSEPKTPAPSPTPTPTPTPSPTPTLIGSPGTHAAHDGYAYGFPEAPDCNEATLGSSCVGDDRGFFQGQCTSWVAHRLSQRNGISFSNWYAGRHWGDAVDWKNVAKSMAIKPDLTPSTGAVAWFKRGHVAYVEQVNYDGSIVLSEMNFDGANGFRFVTVSRASGYWPDKFLHLADVVPYDATAPSAPGRPQVVAHQGRVGLAWRPSYDGYGVAGYRVLRDGVPLAVTGRPSYWDRQVSAGQAYEYTVEAFDAAGNTSPAVRARVAPGAEAADRAWVSTDCRSGAVRAQREAAQASAGLHRAHRRRLASRRAAAAYRLGPRRQPALRDHGRRRGLLPHGRTAEPAPRRLHRPRRHDADLGSRRAVRAAAAPRGRPCVDLDRRRPRDLRTRRRCGPAAAGLRGAHRLRLALPRPAPLDPVGRTHQSRVRRRRRPGLLLPDGQPEAEHPAALLHAVLREAP